MPLDLMLEDQDVMDYVQGKIQEPPSTAPTSTISKYKKGEIKAKLMTRDSIHKSLVAYISKLDTSKEMYDKLVNMVKANNANQFLFFKNQLKNLKKGKDESIQSYFLKLTEIRNNLLAIGERIDYGEMVLNTLGGLSSEWHVFNTTILNNNVIPDFDEVLSRCVQEETRMKEYENEGNVAFIARAKKNFGGSRNKKKGRGPREEM